MQKINLVILLYFSVQTLIAQDFLNGNFEINSAGGDQINISNSLFNSLMPNTTAYGTFGNMDIVTSSSYCAGAQSGNWFVCLTGGETDAVTMALSSPLLAGQTYTMSFFDRACNAFSSGTMPVRIGVTDVSGTTGNVVYTAPLPSNGSWNERVFSFVSPINASFISVTLDFTTTGTNTFMWAHVDNFKILTPPCPLTLNLGNDRNICNGSVLTLDATLPGATYLWHDGAISSTYTVTSTGTYFVTATVGTCNYTDTINISEDPPLGINLGPDRSICPGTVALFDVTRPNATYLWQDGSTTPTYSTGIPGNISVSVTVGQCSESDAVNLSVFDFTPVDLGPDIQTCVGTSVLLDPAIPGYSYQWQDGSINQTFTAAETGTCTVQYSNGICTGTDSIHVEFNSIPEFNWADDSLLYCGVTTDKLSAATPGASYQWFDGTTLSYHNITSTQWYWVDVTVEGCSVRDSVFVEYHPVTAIQLESSEDCLQDDGQIVIREKNSLDVVWSNGERGNSLIVDKEGKYEAIRTTTCGISKADIYISECPGLQVYMPNSFTPNADGINDVFSPVIHTNLTIDQYEFYVVNRYGEPVFKCSEMGKVWDGGHLGSRTFVPDGVYVWVLQLKYEGHVHHKTGYVSIIR